MIPPAETFSLIQLAHFVLGNVKEDSHYASACSVAHYNRRLSGFILARFREIKSVAAERADADCLRATTTCAQPFQEHVRTVRKILECHGCCSTLFSHAA